MASPKKNFLEMRLQIREASFKHVNIDISDWGKLAAIKEVLQFQKLIRGCRVCQYNKLWLKKLMMVY